MGAFRINNLYKELDIDSQATNEEIKKAYRKKALQYHPDRNKNNANEKFNCVVLAYRVLSDSNKRKEYDDFGTIDDGLRENKLLQLSVAMLITEFISIIRNNDPPTIFEIDIIYQIKDNLLNRNEKKKSAQEINKKNIETLSKISKKLILNKGKIDCLGDVLKKRINEIKQSNNNLLTEIKAVDKAIELADNYNFDYEETFSHTGAYPIDNN